MGADGFNIGASRMSRMPLARRTFLKSLPAAAALPLSQTTPTAGQPAAPASEITRQTLREAEKIDGIAFSDAERDGMTANVAANRENVESIRRVQVDYDVEPAITFKPIARAPLPPGPATPHAKLTVDRPRFTSRPSDDTIAFLPLTALASLIESRLISSSDLTELYLARLKRYGPKLE